MTKKEMSQKGLEIVAYSGEARSYYLRALKCARNQEFDKAEKLIADAEEVLNLAHQTQTDLLTDEAQEKFSDVTMIMVHGQDHLMTTSLLRDLMTSLLDIYRQGQGKK